MIGLLYMNKMKLIILKVKKCINKISHINISFVCFGVIILFMLAILLPRCTQRFPCYSILSENLGLPYELKIYGKLVLEDEMVDYSSYTIYAGGYNKNVDSSGQFDMVFLSNSREDILITLIDGNDNICFFERVSILYGDSMRLDIKILR